MCMGNMHSEPPMARDVSKGGKCSSRIAAPLLEPILIKPIYGKEISRFLSRREVSCKTLLFLDGLMKLLEENGRTFALKPSGALSVCSMQDGRELGSVGAFSNSFHTIDSITIDTFAFGIGKNSSCAELAFDFLLSASRINDDILDAFLSQEDLEAMEKSDRFIFTVSPGLSLKRIHFTSEGSTTYYLDVEGIRKLSTLPKLSFFWDEKFA